MPAKSIPNENFPFVVVLLSLNLLFSLASGMSSTYFLSLKPNAMQSKVSFPNSSINPVSQNSVFLLLYPIFPKHPPQIVHIPPSPKYFDSPIFKRNLFAHHLFTTDPTSSILHYRYFNRIEIDTHPNITKHIITSLRSKTTRKRAFIEKRLHNNISNNISLPNFKHPLHPCPCLLIHTTTHQPPKLHRPISASSWFCFWPYRIPPLLNSFEILSDICHSLQIISRSFPPRELSASQYNSLSSLQTIICVIQTI
ncbi:hypothetical protein INT48_004575 [Thamnidium elegans]|uniref:Uncharacterized protein n=1 Tax=Thamnidium elegans TaxID=101142 RepID=A0A8H7T0L6_9FUNG|nr:hypothetical protein INT48_004575 [Thamnidium elegans]